MKLKKLLRFIHIPKSKFIRFTDINRIPEINSPPEIVEVKRYRNINFLLDKFESFENEIHKSKIKKFFFSCVIFLCFFLGYKLRGYFENHKKKLAEELIIEEFEKILTNSIIKFVFHNKGLYNDLSKTLNKFLQKDPTEIFITKLLERLLRSKILFVKSDDLLINKLLLQKVLQDKEIENKLKNLIIKILKNESVRKNLIDTLINFTQSPTAYQLGVKGFFNGLNNQNNKERFSGEIKNFIYEKLDERVYFKILTESLIDLLKNLDI